MGTPDPPDPPGPPPLRAPPAAMPRGRPRKFPSREAAEAWRRRASSPARSPSPAPKRTGAPRTKVATLPEGKKTHYEFCGPPGAVGITLGLPLVCYLLVAACNAQDGCIGVAPVATLADRLRTQVTSFVAGTKLATADGAIAYLAWFAFCVVLHLALVGHQVQGTVLRNGERLPYKMNGLTIFLVSTIGAAAAAYSNVFDLAYAYRAYVPLLTASVAFSFALSVYVYAMSFAKDAKGKPKLLAEGGNTGNVVYDFFIGRELNPRIGTFDWKCFCELIPGLTLWVLLDMACVHAAYVHAGGQGWAGLPPCCKANPAHAVQAIAEDLVSHVPVGLLLVTSFHWWYVFDALYNERSILTTMDITTDGFGYMLAFGDLAWVPFTYSLPARYLADRVVAGDDASTPTWLALASFALFVLGYSIFRGANGTKDTFRRDPKDPRVKHIKTLSTKRGTKLMVSGWWGIARHINYTGDWLLGLAWCLPCGSAVVPYFYAIYFAVLLVHRDLRDEEQCEKKYGADWAVYKSVVPYRFVLGVY